MQMLSIYHSIYVPNLTYDNELLCSDQKHEFVDTIGRNDKGKSSVIWGGLGVELLLLLTEMIVMPPG